MKRKIKIKIQKIFQATYLLTFFILAIGISGNIELNIETPKYIWLLFIISGILTIGKMIYHSLKFSKSKYTWH